MTGWNMPPGTNESMIPGNRAEDQYYEALCGRIEEVVAHALEGELVIVPDNLIDQLADLVLEEVCQNAIENSRDRLLLEEQEASMCSCNKSGCLVHGD